MLTKTFKTMITLEKYVENKCEEAVKISCNRLLGTLQELIISEYYNKYDPVQYKRSFDFYRSAMVETLSPICGKVFMNPSEMNYINWDGLTQIIKANDGVHGGWATEESLTGHYWDEFLKYCEKNAIRILKEELKKQGLIIKKIET